MKKRYRLQEGVELENAEIFRGGVTAKKLTFEFGSRINLQSFYESGKINLSFGLNSKGGGRTIVSVNIGEADYSSVLQGMLSASPQEFIRAYVKMGGEIRRFLESDVRASTYVGYSGKVEFDDHEEEAIPVMQSIVGKAKIFDALKVIK